MTERDERPEGVKDDGRIDLPIPVQLAKELDGSDPTLVVLEDVGLSARGSALCFYTKERRRANLESRPNVLDDLVDNADGKVRMETSDLEDEDGKRADVGELDFPDLRKGLVQEVENLMRPRVHQCVVQEGRRCGTQRTSGSSQCSLRMSLSTLSTVFLMRMSWMRCRTNCSIGGRSFCCTAERSGGLHWNWDLS